MTMNVLNHRRRWHVKTPKINTYGRQMLSCEKLSKRIVLAFPLELHQQHGAHVANSNALHHDNAIPGHVSPFKEAYPCSTGQRRVYGCGHLLYEKHRLGRRKSSLRAETHSRSRRQTPDLLAHQGQLLTTPSRRTPSVPSLSHQDKKRYTPTSHLGPASGTTTAMMKDHRKSKLGIHRSQTYPHENFTEGRPDANALSGGETEVLKSLSNCQEYFIRALTTLAINNVTSNNGPNQQDRRRASHTNFYDRNIQILLGCSNLPVKSDLPSPPPHHHHHHDQHHHQHDHQDHHQEQHQQKQNEQQQQQQEEQQRRQSNIQQYTPDQCNHGRMRSNMDSPNSCSKEERGEGGEDDSEEDEAKSRESDKRERINRLRSHLKCSGLGDPVMVTNSNEETEASKRALFRLVRKVHRGLSPEKQQRLRLKTHLDYEMSLMKGESFCEQQDQVYMRTASADMGDRDQQLLEEEMKDKLLQDLQSNDKRTQSRQRINNARKPMANGRNCGPKNPALRGKRRNFSTTPGDNRHADSAPPFGELGDETDYRRRLGGRGGGVDGQVCSLDDDDDDDDDDDGGDDMSGVLRNPALSRREVRRRVEAWMVEVEEAMGLGWKEKMRTTYGRREETGSARHVAVEKSESDDMIGQVMEANAQSLDTTVESEED